MNETKELTDVLIKLRYDKEVLIRGCEDYGRAKDCDPYFFVQKEGKRTYIPIGQVVSIGPKEHYNYIK